MNTITALYPWGNEPKEFDCTISVKSTLPSGYGHKRVTFEVDHPIHKFADPYVFSIVSSDMPFFDSLDELDSYNEQITVIIERFVDNNETLITVGEWIVEVNERYEEDED